MNPLAVIGRIFLGFLAAIGDLTLFAVRAIVQGLSGPFYPRAILHQMLDIGYYSLPVVGLTAIFTPDANFTGDHDAVGGCQRLAGNTDLPRIHAGLLGFTIDEIDDLVGNAIAHLVRVAFGYGF